jgi:hypothetical protein
MKLGYIIGPFRADTAWQIEQNVRNAETLGLEVARLGAFPVIPHANTRFFHGSLSDDFWLRGTRDLLVRVADFAITVEAIGFPWTHSVGSQEEVALTKSLGRPVFYRLSALESWLQENP